MNKKAYKQPTTGVVMIQQAQMLCISKVAATGLDDDDELKMSSDGEGGDIWKDAW